MKTRNSILIFGALALLLVIGIFAWQLSALPNLRFQIASGLHNSLQTIADEGARQLDAAYTQEIQRGPRALREVVSPGAFSAKNLPALRQEMLLISSTHLLADAWIAAFPDSLGTSFETYAYKRPSRYRKESAQVGSWRQDTELSEFVATQLQTLFAPYATVDSFAATYWQSALDSNLVLVYNKAFNKAVFVGVPWYDIASDSLRGFLFCQTNTWQLEQVFIRDFFNDRFWKGEDKVEGLQRKHLQIGVMAGKGDKIVYNSVAYGAQEFEHTAALADINSWLSDYKVGIRFRGASVDEVAQAIYNRNLYLILAMFVLLIVFLALLLRAARKMVRLSRMKTEFVANVSHEIKTPLASIRLATDTLKLGRARTTEQQEKVLGILDSEAERLQALVNNLLDFSQLEAGRKKYRMEAVSAMKLWQEAQQLLQSRYAGPKTYSKADFSEHLSVRIDLQALTQVLAILIDNAKKYGASEQGFQLSAKVAGSHFQLALRDFGIGISKDNQELIFEKFVRVGNVDEHNVKGHGIGLSIARAIVRDHGGKILLESKLNQGSTFTISLPILQTDVA